MHHDDMERPPPGQADGGQEQSRWGPDGTRSVRTETPDAHYRQPSIEEALEEGRRRRDDGMQSAEHSTEVAWNRVAAQVIRGLAETGQPFTAEDVRAVTGDPIGSPNAMGAAFGKAARAGMIRRVDARQSTRPEAAGRWLTVWKGAA